MEISSKMSFLSLKSVKQKLRKMIFKKVLLLNVSYNKKLLPQGFYPQNSISTALTEVFLIVIIYTNGVVF